MGASGTPAARQEQPLLFPLSSLLPPPPPFPPPLPPPEPESDLCPASCGPPASKTPFTHALFTQVWLLEHTPHTIVLMQPSGTVPQAKPVGQDVTVGIQPHWFAVPPPPQVLGVVQAPPQVTVPPQPSGIVPQAADGQGALHAVSTETCAVAACTAEVAVPMTMKVGAGVP